MSSFRPDHELHQRRRGRNIGMLAVLLGFVALVFMLTVVKVQNGGKVEAFDHTARPSLTVPEGQK